MGPRSKSDPSSLVQRGTCQVVKAWATPSSGGSTTYETLLWSDGSLSCNCPAWRFMKKGQPRSCKHVRDVNAGKPVKVATIRNTTTEVSFTARSASVRPAPVGRLIRFDEEV